MQPPFPVDVVQVPLAHDYELVEAFLLRLWMNRSTCAIRLGETGVLRLIVAPLDSIVASKCAVNFVSLSRITYSGARFRSSALPVTIFSDETRMAGDMYLSKNRTALCHKCVVHLIARTNP